MLTDLDTIKALYGVSDPGLDAQLSALLVAADRAIKDYLHRDIELTSYVEYYSGNGTRFLTLRQRPVVSVTEVREDFSGFYGQGTAPIFGSETLLVAGEDYALELDAGGTLSNSGRLIRCHTVWAQLERLYVPGRVSRDTGSALGNIKVTYSAGYASVPDDLKYAVAMLVAYMRRVIKLGQNISSEKLGDYGYHLARTALRDVPEVGSLRSILARYKEPCW